MKNSNITNNNTSKSYLNGSAEDGFSLSEVKSLEIGRNITFHFKDSLLDGKIIDKQIIDYDTVFTIETEKGKLKKSYKLLNVYKIYSII